jgi:hypothetical protein
MSTMQANKPCLKSRKRLADDGLCRYSACDRCMCMSVSVAYVPKNENGAADADAMQCNV